MNTPTTIREHYPGGTPASCKRKTVSPVEDAAVRNVRPKWDRKKNALCHLREDEQEEERLRPITKASSTAATAHLHIQMDQPRGSDRALLDSIIAKTTLLRKDQLKLGALGTLSSDKAKYIPLVFENLMKLSDHAKQSTEKPKNDKEVEDLKRELHELSNRRNSDAEYIKVLRKKRDTLVSEGEKLLSRGNDYHSLYLEECRRATELTKECKELRSESRHSTDEYHLLYLDECRRTTELAAKCKKLRSEKRQSEEDHNKLYLDERRRTTELTKECEELRSKLDKAKYDLRTEKYFYKLCRESFYELLGEKAAVKEQLKQTKAECEAVEEDLEDLREEQGQALAELRTATNSEKQGLQDQIKELTEARNTEVATSSNLQNELHVLQNSYAKEIISKQAAAVEDRRKCLSEQKDRHQSETAKMQEDHRLEIGGKNGQMHQLEQDKRGFKGQITKMKKEHSLELRKKQEEIQRLERDNGHHKGRITKITQEHRLQVEEKEDQILRLEQEKASIEGQTAGLEINHQLKLEKTRDQILQLEREINSFGGQRAELEANHRLELLERQHRVLGLEQENDGYKTQIADMEAEHQLVIEQKESRIQLLARENDGYVREKTKEIEDLQAELKTKQDQIRALEQGMNDYSLEKTAKIEDLQTQLQRACSSQEEQNNTLKKLSDAFARKEESVEILQTKLAVYARERRFQLGLFDRSTLFGEFSYHAKGALDARSFAGKIGGQRVDVCMSVLSATKEVLVVLQRCKDGAYMVWQSRMEDFTTFHYDWLFWIRLEEGMEGKSVYISMDVDDKVCAWLSPLLSSWVLSTEERNSLLESGERK